MTRTDSWQAAFRRTIMTQREQGFGWRFDGVESWTTEAIFAKFRELDIDTGADQFPDQAAAAGGIDALRDQWTDQIAERFVGQDSLWVDYPLIAVPVLWERLAAHIVCPELIERRLYKAISALEQGDPLPAVGGLPAEVAAALGLARYLKQFPLDQRAALYDEIDSDGGYYDYTEWFFNVIAEQGRQYPDVFIELVDVISTCREESAFQLNLADVLAKAGRRDEAVARVRANQEKFPGDCWVNILAGDVFGTLGDNDEALRLWTQVIAAPSDEGDYEAAASRIGEVYRAQGKHAEFDDLLERYPSPFEDEDSDQYLNTDAFEPRLPPTEFIEPEREFEPVEQLKRGDKVGRNEPCPCGSGKKYKKCCGK